MQTFPKSARILDARGFGRVKRGGVRTRSGLVAVALLPGQVKRLGVVVSRQVGTAVARNRIKRVIREFFRLHRTLFPAGDCVVIPRQGSAQLSNEELRAELARALEKLSPKT